MPPTVPRRRTGTRAAPSVLCTRTPDCLAPTIPAWVVRGQYQESSCHPCSKCGPHYEGPQDIAVADHARLLPPGSTRALANCLHWVAVAAIVNRALQCC